MSKLISFNNKEICNFSDMYSEKEHIIGKWIDGKTIYRKVVPVTMPTSATTIDIPINIDNLSYIVNLKGIIKSNFAHNYRPLPFADSTVVNNVRLAFDVDHIRIKTGDSWSGYAGYIILEYTKTTD